MTKKLEPRNFRIDSDGWKEKVYGDVTCKINPENDVIEYVSGVSKKLVGEQLFTWDAAMRETKKAGKRMPTKEEWEELRDEVIGCGVYPGYLTGSAGALPSRGSFGYYWSSTELSSTYGYYLAFYSASSSLSDFDKVFGFSVRCLSDIAEEVGELDAVDLSVGEMTKIVNHYQCPTCGYAPEEIAQALYDALKAKRNKAL